MHKKIYCVFIHINLDISSAIDKYCNAVKLCAVQGTITE